MAAAVLGMDLGLEVFRLDGATYRFIVSYEGEMTAAVEHFDAIELKLATLWRNRA